MAKAKLSEVAQTFQAAGYTESDTSRILKTLMAGGHVDLENGTSPAGALQANAADGDMTRVSENGYIKQRTLADVANDDPQRMALVRNVLGQCRTLGVDFDPSARISVPALDMQLRGKDVTARLKLKQSLSLLGLIP